MKIEEALVYLLSTGGCGLTAQVRSLLAVKGSSLDAKVRDMTF